MPACHRERHRIKLERVSWEIFIEFFFEKLNFFKNFIGKIEKIGRVLIESVGSIANFTKFEGQKFRILILFVREYHMLFFSMWKTAYKAQFNTFKYSRLCKSARNAPVA